MSNIFAQERGSHWYHPDGTACHIQPDGKKTTLRHARKQGLLPSVTNILSILPKHNVEDWRVEQAVLATMRCMVQPGASNHTSQEMLNLVATQLEDATSAGRKFGTEIHSIVEHINETGELPPPMSPIGALHPAHAKAYLEWFKGSGFKVLGCEKRVVGRVGPENIGFAGCLDLVADRGGFNWILDFKTQAVRDGKPKFYPEWAYQLAAYAISDDFAYELPCLASVVIDSGPAATVTFKEWDIDQVNHSIEVFSKAAALWAAVKDYQPSYLPHADAT